MTRLEIISDVVCPWCYIGKLHLDRAMAEAGNPFAIRWRPFQLQPDMPAEGMDHAAYYEAKFGPEQAEAIRQRITAAAAAAGGVVDFSRIKRAVNTLDAHRLLRWAEPEGVQHDLAGILFRRYFTEGEDISRHEILVNAAEEAGMDGQVAARLLSGEADRQATQQDAEAAREMGVTGVPTFLLGGTYAISGAQPPEVWAKLIRELEAARETMAQQQPDQGPE